VRYDASYQETHELSDGTIVTLRCIRPEDREGLERAFSKLSRQTRVRRFLSEVPRMTDAMARYLTEVDGQDHVAIVATKDSLNLKEEEGIGVARFCRLKDEPEVAEAAVTVIDADQGKGLGRMLLKALTEAARERGITMFRAAVLAENEPMRRILDEAGAVIRKDEGDTLIADVPIEAGPEGWRDWPVFRLLRVAAELTRSALLGALGE